jgi:uncharacterized protein YbjT (DUF2867 family)
MILVTTSGRVGSEAARVLAEQAVPVRILARDPDKAAALTRVGVDVVHGDLDVPATIDQALDGVSSVVLVSPAVPAQELRVVDAAVRAGVQHVVKITSKASADSPIARRRNQHEIEIGLIASGIDYTLLRNNAYMQNFLMLAPSIAETSAFGSSTGDGRVGMVDTRDVGAVAAQIAASPSGHAGQIYWPTGPESLSYADVAAVLTRVLGRPITFHPLTYEEEKKGMLTAGVPAAVAEMNAQALQLFAQGDSDWVTDDVPRILGRPARTFEQFAIDYAPVFA